MSIWLAIIVTAILTAPLGFLIGARLPRTEVVELEDEIAILRLENSVLQKQVGEIFRKR